MWRDSRSKGNGVTSEGFSQDEQLMAEIYASHVSIALSYAKALDVRDVKEFGHALIGTVGPSPKDFSLLTLTPPSVSRRLLLPSSPAPSASTGLVDDKGKYLGAAAGGGGGGNLSTLSMRDQSSVGSNIEDIKRQVIHQRW